VTNLALHKILYLAHMVFMGRTGERLVHATFQAWDYGPVEPDLYRKVRIFGDRPVRDIFFSAPPLDDSPESSVIDEACDHLLDKRPAELVAMTHWKDGAWAKHYRPGVLGIVIPDEDIIAEYNARTAS
jgi:uncharacterized phage-associated protein